MTLLLSKHKAWEQTSQWSPYETYHILKMEAIHL